MARISIFSNLTRQSIKSHNNSHQAREGNKGIQIRKEEVILSISAVDMMVYTEDSRVHEKSS